MSFIMWDEGRKKRDPRLLYDTFTGAGALVAHTPEKGGPWTVAVDAFSNLSGGSLPHANGVADGCAIAPCVVADFEMTCALTINSNGSTGAPTVGLTIRSNAGGTNRLMIGMASFFHYYKVYQYTGLTTSSTVVDTVAVAAITAGAHTLAYWAYKDIHRCFLDGTLIMGWYSTLLQTNTYHGVGNYSDFNGGSWESILVNPTTGWLTMSVLGDSISVLSETPTLTPFYHNIVARTFNNARVRTINHAVTGHNILVTMDADVVATASDDADMIIIALGTNDPDNAGITAEYQENIIELAASNPRAKIYCMGILPRTVDAARLANNPRIAQAVTNAIAAGVNCVYWDTDGWINPATQTSDGIHPTAAGHAAIAAQVLALLP